jgi:hypothetical protein
LVDVVRDSPVVSHRHEVSWLACLIPNAQVDHEENLSAVKELLSSRTTPADEEVVLMGALLYRVGQYVECVERLTALSAKLEQATSPPDQYTLALARFFLAMARHQLGHERQASRLFHEANFVQQQLQSDPSANWTWVVALNVLHREATGLIDP